eukprot:Skav229332  [mRNA]  locus=scaffold2917:96062:105952:- [translate_table: standard]
MHPRQLAPDFCPTAVEVRRSEPTAQSEDAAFPQLTCSRVSNVHMPAESSKPLATVCPSWIVTSSSATTLPHRSALKGSRPFQPLQATRFAEEIVVHMFDGSRSAVAFRSSIRWLHDQCRSIWHMDGQLLTRAGIRRLVIFWSANPGFYERVLELGTSLGLMQCCGSRSQARQEEHSHFSHRQAIKAWPELQHRLQDFRDRHHVFVETWFLHENGQHVCIRPRRLFIHIMESEIEFRRSCLTLWKDMIEPDVPIDFVLVRPQPARFRSTAAHFIIVQTRRQDQFGFLMQCDSLPTASRHRAVLATRGSPVFHAFVTAQLSNHCVPSNMVCFLEGAGFGRMHQHDPLPFASGALLAGDRLVTDHSSDDTDSGSDSSGTEDSLTGASTCEPQDSATERGPDPVTDESEDDLHSLLSRSLVVGNICEGTQDSALQWEDVPSLISTHLCKENVRSRSRNPEDRSPSQDTTSEAVGGGEDSDVSRSSNEAQSIYSLDTVAWQLAHTDMPHDPLPIYAGVTGPTTTQAEQGLGFPPGSVTGVHVVHSLYEAGTDNIALVEFATDHVDPTDEALLLLDVLIQPPPTLSPGRANQNIFHSVMITRRHSSITFLLSHLRLTSLLRSFADHIRIMHNGVAWSNEDRALRLLRNGDHVQVVFLGPRQEEMRLALLDWLRDEGVSPPDHMLTNEHPAENVTSPTIPFSIQEQSQEAGPSACQIVEQRSTTLVLNSWYIDHEFFPICRESRIIFFPADPSQWKRAISDGWPEQFRPDIPHSVVFVMPPPPPAGQLESDALPHVIIEQGHRVGLVAAVVSTVWHTVTPVVTVHEARSTSDTMHGQDFVRLAQLDHICGPELECEVWHDGTAIPMSVRGRRPTGQAVSIVLRPVQPPVEDDTDALHLMQRPPFQEPGTGEPVSMPTTSPRASTGEPDLPALPPGEVVALDILQQRFDAFVRSGASDFGRSIEVCTYYLSTVRLPTCPMSRIVSLSQNSISWRDRIIEAWADIGAHDLDFHLFVVQPHPPSNVGFGTPAAFVLVVQHLDDTLKPVLSTRVERGEHLHIAHFLTERTTRNQVFHRLGIGAQCSGPQLSHLCTVQYGHNMIVDTPVRIEAGAGLIVTLHEPDSSVTRQDTAALRTTLRQWSTPSFSGTHSQSSNPRDVPEHSASHQGQSTPQHHCICLEELCHPSSHTVCTLWQHKDSSWSALHFDDFNEMRAHAIQGHHRLRRHPIHRTWIDLPESSEPQIVCLPTPSEDNDARDCVVAHTATPVSTEHEAMAQLHRQGIKKAVIDMITQVATEGLTWIDFTVHLPDQQPRSIPARHATPWPRKQPTKTDRPLWDLHSHRAGVISTEHRVESAMQLSHVEQLLTPETFPLCQSFEGLEGHFIAQAKECPVANPDPETWAHFDRFVIFTDGSAVTESGRAVWAFVVLAETYGHPPEVIGWRAGHVNTQEDSPLFVHSESATSATAEREAMIWALWWRRTVNLDKATFFWADSTCALDVATGRVTSSPHDKGASYLRALFQALDMNCPPGAVEEMHVKGHAGTLWNEVADSIAAQFQPQLLKDSPFHAPTWSCIVPHLWCLMQQHVDLPEIAQFGFNAPPPCLPQIEHSAPRSEEHPIAQDSAWYTLIMEDLRWMWHQLRGSSALPDPDVDHLPWERILLHQRKYWKKLVRRAVAHHLKQERNRRHVQQFHGRLVETLGSLTISGTQCGACLREYHTVGKIQRRLQHSRHCRSVLLQRGQQRELLPGIGSAAERDLVQRHDGLLPTLQAAGPRLPVQDMQPDFVDYNVEFEAALFQHLTDVHDEGGTLLAVEHFVQQYVENHPMGWTEFTATLHQLRAHYGIEEERHTGISVDDLRQLPLHLAEPDRWPWLAADQPPARPPEHTIPEWHRVLEVEEMAASIRTMQAAPRPLGRHRVLLHFFAGRRRPGDVQYFVDRWQPPEGVVFHVVSLDVVHDIDLGDLSKPTTRLYWLGTLRSCWALGFIAGPPCETWSQARQVALEGHARGPRPIRSGKEPWGLASLRLREIDQVGFGNVLLSFSLEAAAATLVSQGIALLEHPAEPEDQDAPTIWRLPALRLLRQHPAVSCFRCSQGYYGAPTVKPTMLMTINLPDLEFSLWRDRLSETLPTGASIGRDETGAFKTSPLKEYPPGFCKSIAETICFQGSQPAFGCAEQPSSFWAKVAPMQVSYGRRMGPDYAA